MNKINIKTAKWLTMFAIVAHSAEAIPADPGSGPGCHHPIFAECTTAVYDDVNQIHGTKWSYLQQGHCDTTAIAKDLVANKDTFNDYLAQFVGTFSPQTIAKTLDVNDSWESLLYSMNALVGPVLQAPFFDDTVSADALETYRQKLVSYGHVANNETGLECASDYSQNDDVPRVIAFPINTAYNWQPSVVVPPSYVASTYWNVAYYTKPDYVQMNILTNNNAQCDSNGLSYAKSVTSETSATSEKSVSNSFTASQSITISASCEAELTAAKLTSGYEVEAAFEETTDKTFTTSETETTSETQEVSNSYTLQVPNGATVNATQYIDRMTASLVYSNDMHYANSTKIYVYQSLGYYNSQSQDMPSTTLEEMKDLANLAMETMGVTVDPVLIDGLFSGSIRGSATTQQGVQVRTITNACETSQVPPGQLHS
eukprot:Clim_evm8s143 gene=Clim_evmTU8s143